MKQMRDVSTFCACGECKSGGNMGGHPWSFTAARECYCCVESKESKTKTGKMLAGALPLLRVSLHEPEPPSCVTKTGWFMKLCMDPEVTIQTTGLTNVTIFRSSSSTHDCRVSRSST